MNSLSLVKALERLQSIRKLEIKLPAIARIPATRIAALAQFASTAKVGAILRLPQSRRLATLVSFVHYLEATAQDDALEVLEALLHDLFGNAIKADKKARLRTLKDLDLAASILARACQFILDPALSDNELRNKLFEYIPHNTLAQALESINKLIRPSDDVYYQELEVKYRTVRRFLPMLLEHIHFNANSSGEHIVAALDWLHNNLMAKKSDSAPTTFISKAWQNYIFDNNGSINIHAYIFCVLQELQTALKRRDIFVTPSWRYADPRAGLLDGAEWKANKPMICRTLGLSVDPESTLSTLADELDRTYRAVATRLSHNSAVRFEVINDKTELILSPLDQVEEPESLTALREKVANMLPRVDLSELILEVAARTHFTDAFTHVSERTARATDLSVSLCAVLMAEACNIGLESLIHNDIPALKRDRLSWTSGSGLTESYDFDSIFLKHKHLLLKRNSLLNIPLRADLLIHQ